jgi:hypothetical protein
MVANNDPGMRAGNFGGDSGESAAAEVSGFLDAAVSDAVGAVDGGMSGGGFGGGGGGGWGDDSGLGDTGLGGVDVGGFGDSAMGDAGLGIGTASAAESGTGTSEVGSVGLDAFGGIGPAVPDAGGYSGASSQDHTSGFSEIGKAEPTGLEGSVFDPAMSRDMSLMGFSPATPSSVMGVPNAINDTVSLDFSNLDAMSTPIASVDMFGYSTPLSNEASSIQGIGAQQAADIMGSVMSTGLPSVNTSVAATPIDKDQSKIAPSTTIPLG